MGEDDVAGEEQSECASFVSLGAKDCLSGQELLLVRASLTPSGRQFGARNPGDEGSPCGV